MQPVKQSDDQRGSSGARARTFEVGAVPVLAIGRGVTLLGTIRSLGRAGIPTLSVLDADDLVQSSRWFRPARPDVPVERNIPDLAEYLEALPIERAVLMPCSDDWCNEVAALPRPLRERFLPICADAEVLEMFIDKKCFRRLAATAEVPHPITLEVDTSSDLNELPTVSFAGAFLKPCDSNRFVRDFALKAMWARSIDELHELVHKTHAKGHQMLIQEYIPGPASNHYFIDGFVNAAGRIQTLFARRRLRMSPPDFGNSSYMISVPLAEVAPAVDSLRRLITSAGYRGIFSGEFKFDERDGLFKVLEVNARPWLYIEFATDCGVDVAAMAYHDALGSPIEAPDVYRVGRKLVYPYFDWPACKQLWWHGDLSLGSWAWSWLTSTRPVLAWDDPMPAANQLSRRVARRLRRYASGGSVAAAQPRVAGAEGNKAPAKNPRKCRGATH